MDPEVIIAFDDAQRRSIALVSSLIEGLEAGMSETDIYRQAASMLPRFGFTTWFRPPEVQIGSRTSRAPIWRLPSPRVRLKPGDPIVLSMGPASQSAYGDVGLSLVFQHEDSPLIQDARECTRATCGFASRWKCTGELYVFAHSWAVNHRYRLANQRSIGHVILPPQGVYRHYSPRLAHAATWLRRHQILFLNPHRMSGLYAIRPQLSDGTIGASFQEMILVTDTGKRVLGRSGEDEIGVFGGAPTPPAPRPSRAVEP